MQLTNTTFLILACLPLLHAPDPRSFAFEEVFWSFYTLDFKVFD